MRYDTCTCGNRKQARSKRCSGCADNGNAPGGSCATSTGPLRDEFVVAGNTATLSKVSPEEVRTEDDLVRVCKIDLAVWEIVEMRCSASQVMNVPRAVGESKNWSRPSTEPVTTQLFHISAKLRRKVALIAAREEIAALVEDAKKSLLKAPARFTILRPTSPGVMLELALPDLHMGKLAWAEETGEENYDSKIAARVFEDAVEALLARTSGHKIEKILFPLGNDFFNSDNKQGTTTAGTPLDNDSRYHKMFRTGRRLVTQILERLAPIAPVEAVIVPGNHSTLAEFHLGEALDCYFTRHRNITIDNAPTLRKYKQFGHVMLLFTHGNRGKLAEYPLLMATEKPEMWGVTRFKEAHTGDKHQTRVQEFKGVKVRISPALCPSDAWHSEHQFVGNARSAEAFVWDKNEGLIAQATYTVPRATLLDDREAA